MLRPVAERDIAFLTALRGDVETQHLLLAHPKGPSSEADVRSWIRRRVSEPGGWFRVIADDASVAVGFVQLSGVHGIDRHGTLGICLGREARGRGFGQAAMRAALADAATLLKLRKILLYVRADNAAALQLYQVLGFRAVGVLERHYAETPDRLHDVVLMEKLIREADPS